MNNNTEITYQTQQIKVVDTNLPIIEYKDQRVITFSLIDQVHCRPDGTARKRFNDNRKRFIESDDYYPLDSNSLSEIRTHAPSVFSESAQHAIVITETGYLMLVKSFTDDLAWQVQRELVNNYFALPTQQPTSQSSAQLDAEITIAKAAADMLRMSDDSKLKMLYQISDEHNLSTGYLPQYVKDDETKALTTLLKESGSKVSGIAANKILLELGILEEKQRPSSSKGVKKFKSLTKEGLFYGKNLVSPNNPRETQPHYYVNKFQELLDRIDSFLRDDTVMGGVVLVATKK